MPCSVAVCRFVGVNGDVYNRQGYPLGRGGAIAERAGPAV